LQVSAQALPLASPETGPQHKVTLTFTE